MAKVKLISLFVCSLCRVRTVTFDKTDIIIFMLGVVYQGVAFPLLFAMLPKRGNSNSAERIALVERFVRLFGKECIECLVADRELVGEKWMAWTCQKIARLLELRGKNKDVPLLLPDPRLRLQSRRRGG